MDITRRRLLAAFAGLTAWARFPLAGARRGTPASGVSPAVLVCSPVSPNPKEPAMASQTYTTLYPGTPPGWREFDVRDYDPRARIDSDEDRLGALIRERKPEDAFGITVTAGPADEIPDALVRRLSGALIPTRIERRSREDAKVDAGEFEELPGGGPKA